MLRFLIAFILLLLVDSSLLMAQKKGLEKIDSLLLQLPKAKEDTNKLNLLKDICTVYNSIDYKNAIRYATQAEDLALKLKLNNEISELNYFLGNIYLSHSEFIKALDCYNKSMQIEQQKGDKEAMASLYNNVATANLSLGNYPKAIESNLKALKMFEEIGNNYGAANCHINIGYVYMNIKDNKAALTHNLKALELYTKMNAKAGIALSLNNLANNYYENKNVIKMLEMFKKALVIYEELKDEDGMEMAFINISMSYMELRDYDKALDFGYKALKIAKEHDSKEGISYDLMTISDVYYRMAIDDSLDQSKATAFKSKAASLMLAKRGIDSSILLLKDLNMLKEYADAAELASKISKASGNYKDAYEKYELFKTLNDSLFNMEKEKKIT